MQKIETSHGLRKWYENRKFLYNKDTKITLMVKVGFTRHAEDMLRERKFTQEEIISVIRNHDWREDDEQETEVWHVFKRIGKKVLRVVIKGREEPYTVITMFYDKRLRNRK